MPDLFLPTYSTFAALFWLSVLALAIPQVRERAAQLFQLPPATNQAHLAGLDAFRGLAALFVAMFHTWQWPQPALNDALSWLPFLPQGNKAVPIFVTLSGLLIYRAIARAKTLDDLRTYVRRRFFRIFPVYAATILAIWLFLRPQGLSAPFQYFLAESFALRSLGFPAFINPQNWSLYVEILFYAIAPGFVLISRKRPMIWALSAFAVFALGDFAGPRELGLWKYFCGGMICAEIIDRWQPNNLLATLTALLGTAIIVADFATGFDWLAKAIMFVSNDRLVIFGGDRAYTLSLAVGTILLLSGATRSTPFRFVLESWPLRALGAVSYSLFMWHSFMIVADLSIRFDGLGGPTRVDQMPGVPAWYLPVIIVPGLLAVSCISYLALERPFLLRRGAAARPASASAPPEPAAASRAP